MVVSFRIAVPAAALLLACCSTGFQPDTLASDENGVTVEYSTRFHNVNHAITVANDHCAEYGKQAAFRKRQGGRTVIAFFDCVDIYEKWLPQEDEDDLASNQTFQTIR